MRFSVYDRIALKIIIIILFQKILYYDTSKIHFSLYVPSNYLLILYHFAFDLSRGSSLSGMTCSRWRIAKPNAREN